MFSGPTSGAVGRLKEEEEEEASVSSLQRGLYLLSDLYLQDYAHCASALK